MPVFEVLCLANSKKHGGRCVAGLRTDGGGWLRPVAPAGDGALHPGHYTLSDGTEARVLDTIRLEVGRQSPRPHQPENWNITGKRWELVSRPTPYQTLSLLLAHLEEDPVLFGNLDPRVPFQPLVGTPARASLALIAPRDLAWRVTLNPSGEKRLRARFRQGAAHYELPVTDPTRLDSLDDMQPGIYPAPTAGVPPDQVPLLVLSLGEPFDGYCYKLVAAVFGVDSDWWNQERRKSPARGRESRVQTVPASAPRDALVAEFAARRHTELGSRLAEAFEQGAASGQTEDEAVHRLREVMEQRFLERLDETAGD